MTGNICLFSEQYDLFISLKCGPHIVTEFASCLFTWGSLEFQWFNHRWHSDQTTLYECTYGRKESSRITLPMTQGRCKQSSSPRLPCGALGGKHTTARLLYFPNYFSPSLTLPSCFQKGKRDLGSKVRRNGFYSPSSPPTGRLLPPPQTRIPQESGRGKGERSFQIFKEDREKGSGLTKALFPHLHD